MAESIYGVWWTPKDKRRKVPGHLTWNPPYRPTLDLLDPPESFWSEDHFAPIPIVLGDVARHGYMTLLNCRPGGLNIGLTTTHSLQVGSAITRVWLDDPSDAYFRRVEADIPVLALLLGARPIRFKKRLSNRSRQARLDLDDRHHAWTADGVTIEVLYNWRVHELDLGVNLEMIPQVYLSSATSRTFDYWLSEWLVPLNMLLQLAAARTSRLRSVSLWSKKNIKPIERAVGRIEVWTAGVDPEEATVAFRHPDRQLSDPLVSIGQLSVAPLHQVLQRTKTFADEHAVFWGLMSSAFTDLERPLRNRYLDITAALEAYDSRMHGEGPMDVDTYKDERKSALETMTDPAAKKFLKRWVRGRSEYSLEERLRRSAAATSTNLSHDAATMAKVRNDIAHGNAHPDSSLLEECFDQGLAVARRLAIKELGLA